MKNSPFQRQVNGSMSPAKPNDHDTKMACLLFKPNGECYTWDGSWKNDKATLGTGSGYIGLQLRSDRYYELEGSGDTRHLGEAVKLDTGTNTVVSVNYQRGTVRIGE
jgi:hypothetical protein